MGIGSSLDGITVGTVERNSLHCVPIRCRPTAREPGGEPMAIQPPPTWLRESVMAGVVGFGVSAYYNLKTESRGDVAFFIGTEKPPKCVHPTGTATSAILLCIKRLRERDGHILRVRVFPRRGKCLSMSLRCRPEHCVVLAELQARIALD